MPRAATAPLAGAPAIPSDRGGALSFRVVMLTFAALLVLGVGLGVVIHRSYVGFERVAAHHVPADAALVVRWDVEKVALFEPTRRFLLPLLDDARPHGALPNGASAPNGASTLDSRRERFARESGSMIGRDLREVVALFGPGEHDWAIVFAGSFPTGDLIAAAARTLQNEGWAWRSVGPARIASPEGLALGRAEDGAFVLASSPERLDAVLPSRLVPPEVPRVGAGALRLHSAPTGLPAGVAPLLDELGKPTAVEGTAEWGSPLPVHLVLHYAGTLPAEAKERVRSALARLLAEDLDRIERENGRVSIQPAGNQELAVAILLDDAALEHVADRVARAVRGDAGIEPAKR
jgi:hypothetical protein